MSHQLQESQTTLIENRKADHINIVLEKDVGVKVSPQGLNDLSSNIMPSLKLISMKSILAYNFGAKPYKHLCSLVV
jgi:hypothetical protein